MSSKLIFKSLIVFTILPFLSLSASAQAFKTVAEAKGLAVGSKVSKFTAVDQFNKAYSLSDALKKGPVVLMFYRGQWCPVCNRHLSQLQDSLQFIYKKGATVVAISPEKPEFLEKTASKAKASFTLLYDKDYSIAQAFDVLFQPTEKEVSLYNGRLDANLEAAHSDNSSRLPVPATFIINKKGIIVWRHFNPDYRVRASVSEIVKNLPSK
jgi:peroxiredoxin